MAPRLHRPGRATIYLDQSTLSHIYRAWLDPPTADVAYRPLRGWVERVAHEANLCLSVTHIFELAGIPDQHTVQAEGMAAWFDSLPTVWMRSSVDLALEETEHWVEIAAGRSPRSAINPFARDIVGAISTGTDEMRRAAALAMAGSICPFLDAARELLKKQDANVTMRELQDALRINHEAVTEAGWSEERKRDDEALNMRTELRKLAWDAIDRINARHEYGDEPLSRSLVDDFVRLVDRVPNAMPSWRMRHAMARGMASRYRTLRRTEKAEREVRGDPGDYQHAAVGAAYCDVFDCDGTTATRIAGARSCLALAPPLTAKKYPGGAEAFVARLTAEHQ